MEFVSEFTETATNLAATFVIVALIALFPTMLWFCIDDNLAAYTGCPIVGTMSFWFVWPLFMFLRMLGRSLK